MGVVANSEVGGAKSEVVEGDRETKGISAITSPTGGSNTTSINGGSSSIIICSWTLTTFYAYSVTQLYLNLKACLVVAGGRVQQPAGQLSRVAIFTGYYR